MYGDRWIKILQCKELELHLLVNELIPTNMTFSTIEDIFVEKQLSSK